MKTKMIAQATGTMNKPLIISYSYSGHPQMGYHPRLLPGVSNPKPYSVIFVGSPNWCGTIAPPLASWLTKNDLSDKIILPFYSHCGGVPCDFRREISRLCPKAEVRGALGIIEDPGAYLPQILRDWLNKNGL